MKTAYDIILEPVISEQSMDVAQNKKYTFKVATDANKTQVKLADRRNLRRRSSQSEHHELRR